MLDAMKESKAKLKEAENLSKGHQCEAGDKIKQCQQKLFDLTDSHFKSHQQKDS